MSYQVLKGVEFEDPLEIPDGVITDFTITQYYRPNTVSVWLNGLRLLADWDDGFIELGNKQIRMKEAPFEGDSITIEFEPL